MVRALAAAGAAAARERSEQAAHPQRVPDAAKGQLRRRLQRMTQELARLCRSSRAAMVRASAPASPPSRHMRLPIAAA